MYIVNITDIAEDEILSTLRYISNELKAPLAANNLLDEIEGHEDNLRLTPNMYPNVPDKFLADLGLKFIPIKNYLLFFTIDEKSKIVNVIRFMHSRRDWKNILNP